MFLPARLARFSLALALALAAACGRPQEPSAPRHAAAATVVAGAGDVAPADLARLPATPALRDAGTKVTSASPVRTILMLVLFFEMGLVSLISSTPCTNTNLVSKVDL